MDQERPHTKRWLLLHDLKTGTSSIINPGGNFERMAREDPERYFLIWVVPDRDQTT